MKAVVIDIGGVLVQEDLIGVADRSRDRLGLTRDGFFRAVYGGNDDTVLVGNMSEDEWWEVVAGRLRNDVGDLRRELLSLDPPSGIRS